MTRACKTVAAYGLRRLLPVTIFTGVTCHDGLLNPGAESWPSLYHGSWCMHDDAAAGRERKRRQLPEQ